MKMRGSEKKNEQEQVRHFLYKTSNQEVSGSFTARCSRRANQRQRNVQKKKCAARPSPLSNTQLYILFEQTINIIGSFAFSPG